MKKSLFAVFMLSLFVFTSCSPANIIDDLNPIDPDDPNDPIDPDPDDPDPDDPDPDDPDPDDPDPNEPYGPKTCNLGCDCNVYSRIAVSSYSTNDEGENYFVIPNSNITIYENKYYVDLEEVAAYVMAFKKLPSNYVELAGSSSRKTCAATYGDNCRLTNGTYHNDGSYSSPLLIDGADNYIEADTGDYEGNYKPNSRGAYRIVFSLDKGKEILYFTDDHYENFQEYMNFYKGWGAWWGNGGGNYDRNNCEYSYPKTIDTIPSSANYSRRVNIYYEKKIVTKLIACEESY